MRDGAEYIHNIIHKSGTALFHNLLRMTHKTKKDQTNRAKISYKKSQTNTNTCYRFKHWVDVLISLGMTLTKYKVRDKQDVIHRSDTVLLSNDLTSNDKDKRQKTKQRFECPTL